MNSLLHLNIVDSIILLYKITYCQYLLIFRQCKERYYNYLSESQLGYQSRTHCLYYTYLLHNMKLPFYNIFVIIIVYHIYFNIDSLKRIKFRNKSFFIPQPYDNSLPLMLMDQFQLIQFAQVYLVIFLSVHFYEKVIYQNNFLFKKC